MLGFVSGRVGHIMLILVLPLEGAIRYAGPVYPRGVTKKDNEGISKFGDVGSINEGIQIHPSNCVKNYMCLAHERVLNFPLTHFSVYTLTGHTDKK